MTKFGCAQFDDAKKVHVEQRNGRVGPNSDAN